MMEQKNVIVAVLISVLILIGWQYFIEMPRLEKQQAQYEQQQQQQAAQQQTQQQGQPTATAQGTGSPGLGPNLDAAGISAAPAEKVESRSDALSQTPRIRIDSPRLNGSISLQGARIDDLILKEYRETLDPKSPNIELLHPIKSQHPYYAEFGWIGRDVALPTADTVWKTDSQVLSVGAPVTLTWDNGAGLIFEKAISIDADYMLRVDQRVRNTSGESVNLTPYGLVSRTGTPKIAGFYILHEGPIGVLQDQLKEVNYKDLRESETHREQFETTGGWLGFTDKYWLVALVPTQGEILKTRFAAAKRGDEDLYQADFVSPTMAVPAGGKAEYTSRLFAGAKVVRLLDKYEEELGLPLFNKAVDFGWFYFLTYPMFLAIDWLNTHLGNFGLAILALTVMVKLAFFPLANKSYKSMSKMKLLQPKMVELRERYGDDRQKLNQEMMALYRKEGANPAAGCLPILVQIPVFFSLYKVLFVNIEMRHAPFFGWIHDLSAPDPLGILTGFGFFPWDVPASLNIVNIGIWPLFMGLTMFLQQKLNPAPADPIQAKVFAFMPLIFMFMLGSFPAGLVIYWTWNNILSIAQQYVIMRRQGVAIGGGKAVEKKS
jgi:YidC/Oxa1 family membrane protein insertase